MRRRIGSASTSRAAGQWGRLKPAPVAGRPPRPPSSAAQWRAAYAQLSVAATNANGLKTTRTRFVTLVGPHRHRRHRRHVARRP